MKLPQRILSLLSKDTRLYATTLQAITVIEPWAKDNKTVFFPEYTDHSLVHMEEVLASADSLIADDAWEVLTPQDVAVICLAVLLHDCALHLSEDGFLSLLDGSFSAEQSRYVRAEAGWKDLWQQFLSEARRFNEQKLLQLFGVAAPVTTFPNDKLQYTKQHYLLIGEFLRRHHARLAHEIAISGIPGSAKPVSLGLDANPDLLDLAGYVARSHNLALRKAVDAIETAKRRVHLGCHVPFVMALLRLADYLQIQSTRAPGQLLQLKSLNSPVSRDEWQKHLSVIEIHQLHDDPESIFVDCQPNSARTFTGMRRLLDDIQRELDQSWAVIGEIYGRVAPLEKLTITVRRIRSNIDNPEEFQSVRQPPYIAREFRFKTSSAELMDLLVAPLYGADKPGIGVRELVQNSVDACLERDDLVKRNLAKPGAESESDVVVTVYANDADARVVVEDYGVGMTADIIDKYFLNVGASFRTSDSWRKVHETAGHSTVHRTGRFGIGVLAAFLLGPRLNVTTRHINNPADAGLTFDCMSGDSEVEVRPCTFHHGTRIEIKSDTETIKKLLGEERYSIGSWDWYCLKAPHVVRQVVSSSGRKTLNQRYEVPACGSSIEGTSWRRIIVDGYDDVLWGYSVLSSFGYQRREIVVNGIYVNSSAYTRDTEVSSALEAYRMATPTLVVYDPDGRFPLNLQRDRVSGSLGLMGARLNSDISTFLCEGIIKGFEGVQAGISDATLRLSVDPGIVGLRESRGVSTELGAFVITQEGILPTDFDLIKEAKLTSIVLDATNVSAGIGAYQAACLNRLPINYVPVDAVSATKRSRATFLRESVGYEVADSRDRGYFHALPISGRRILVRKRDVDELVPSQLPRYIWTRMSLERDLGDWAVWTQGSVPEPGLDFPAIAGELEESGGFGVAVIYLDWSKARSAASGTEPSALYRSWMAAVSSPLLRLIE